MSNAAHIDALNLNPMKMRFIAAYIETGNATQAAKAAGCRCKSEESFRTRGHQLLKELDLPIQDLMSEAGLTTLHILRTVAQGMVAEQTFVEISKKTGEIFERSVPDWAARARFTDMAIKLKGGYPKQQMELPFEVRDGRVVITAEFASNVTEAA